MQNDYKDDAPAVKLALEKTKSREHIAALSITSENDQTFLNIVNRDKHQIRMESWKFVALIERAGETLRLHEYVTKRYNAPPDPFIFNNNKEGEVVGKFYPQGSSLHIACSINGSQIRDIAKFILDSTYTLCIYATLKRLHEDKERFRRLQERAETLVAEIDPFDSIYHST